MDIRVFKNEEEIGKAVGELYCDFINSKPDCVLGFATGATPNIAICRKIIRTATTLLCTRTFSRLLM